MIMLIGPTDDNITLLANIMFHYKDSALTHLMPTYRCLGEPASRLRTYLQKKTTFRPNIHHLRIIRYPLLSAARVVPG